MKATAAKNTDSTHSANSHILDKTSQPSFFNGEKEQDAFFGGQPFIQPKLTIGQPNDRYEQEADAIADKIVGEQYSPVTTTDVPVQRQEEEQIQEKSLVENITPVVQKQEEEEEMIQQKPIFESPGVMDLHSSRQEGMVQGKEAKANPSSGFEKGLNQSKSGGSPLPSKPREQMETAFGEEILAL